MKFSIKIDQATGQKYMAVPVRGRALLFNYQTNKGTAFSAREREELDLEGLLPPQISTMKQQLDRTYENFSGKTTNIEKFIYLTALQDRNETLYYRLLLEHIEEMMPIVYTPVVGEACQKFSHIYRRGRGIYISYNDRGKIARVLKNTSIENPSIIVVTDGERILGLGDQGAGGMGIPIGKLCLYTLCAGVSPYSTIPITLDVGTDNEERLEDPLYIGLRQKRIRGEAYQAFIDEFVGAVKEVFPHVCLQWEDFLKGNAIRQLNRFRDELCSFNDDIQGTAGVVAAGLYSALRITGKSMAGQKIVFAGAGASAQGVSDLLVAAMKEDGLSEREAVQRIWTVDSKGLCIKDRKGLDDFKLKFARPGAEIQNYACRNRSAISLEETIDNVKPTILIGTSGTPGTFTEAAVRKMAELNARPIIFPLSNPTSKSDAVPSDVLSWSEGRAIVATGSPFDPVELGGKRFRIGQANNALIFPGVGLGVTVARARRVTDSMFLDAAKAMAAMVTQEDLDGNAVYPDLKRIRECSHAVACATVRRAVEEGHADGKILENLEETVRRAMWTPEYLPILYEG
ncbi:MAG: NAD-dependent malic enzyme [Acidobacteria bacterium]|nr:NAD-dependent malic enzyme [Acidobacteriota bacterium]